MIIETAATRLLDMSHPLDVKLFDQVVQATFDPHHPQQAEANNLLMRIKEHPQMWSRADAILEGAGTPQGQFFGLQLLEDMIMTKWKILPVSQRDDMKNYVVAKVISLSETEESMHANKVLLGKMDQVLVSILKQEWPHNWPTFVSDIVGASKTSEVLCENNMQILKLLSEEVFDFGKESMTSMKIKNMKESLNEEFSKVFELCEFVLQHSQRPSLLILTLVTLQRFLTWIPLGYIFETSLIGTLLQKFFTLPLFQVEALGCLTEIAGLTGLNAQYDPLFCRLYEELIVLLSQVVPQDLVLTNYDEMAESEQIFLKKLALFFTAFFRNHRSVVSETQESQQNMIVGLGYLARISEAPDEELFKVCLDYFHILSEELYHVETRARGGAIGIGRQGETTTMGLMGDGVVSSPSGSSAVLMYRDILSQIRRCVISRMAKPEEVLVVEDENGEIVRELTKDTEAIALYKTMRETLVYLTHLNYRGTVTIMLERLSLQVSGQEYSWHNLNTLCWAIGSISGSMTEDEEKRFLVTVIKDLLHLCEIRRGKDNKAVVASNIMYVVGQYPRFLRAHWKFLRTVVRKLFEFMHELHPGVQDMACDTFLKIAQKCKRMFVTTQSQETRPYVAELLEELPSIVSELETHQVHTFYEAVACMLSDKGGSTVAINRTRLLQNLMAMPNASWKDIMTRTGVDCQTILNHDTVKEVTKILRTNVRVCNSVGSLYISQLGDFYEDLLTVYRFYSEHISAAVASQGEIATRLSNIRAMRGAKKEVLRLLNAFLERSGPPDSTPLTVATTIMPRMLEPILDDYKRCIPAARDPEVLTLFTTATLKLHEYMAQFLLRVMDSIFECTLQMITQNFEDFPEHRIQFFKFLKAANMECFMTLFEIPAAQQQLVVDSVVWAFRHTERNIADTGLDILHELLRNIAHAPPQVAQAFYAAHLVRLITEVLCVMTDRLHKSGFKLHATLLNQMFHLLSGGKVTVPLHESIQASSGMEGNKQYLANEVGRILVGNFPNFTESQARTFVAGLFNITIDLPTFKQNMRDFLITIKEFSVEDNSELWHEETAVQDAEAETRWLEARLAVPGLLNPHEVPSNEDDMGDL